MPLFALTDKKDIGRARTMFAKTIRKGSKRRSGVYGGQGFNYQYDSFYWNSKQNIWAILDIAGDGAPRFWQSFGVGEPSSNAPVSIKVEINPPLEGVNFRTAGAFARDAAGRFYIAHSGKIGGGKAGVGKNAFIDYYKGTWQDVMYGVTSRPMIVLGAVDSPRLWERIASFVHDVNDFKTAVTSGTIGISPKPGQFSPEFSGTFTAKKRGGDIEVSADHGIVVNQLQKEIARLLPKHRVSNDRNRDLFVTRGAKHVALFEVKTDINTTCVYGAIGQLMFHGCVYAKPEMLVFVVPGTPNKRTAGVLKQLGISVLKYHWIGETPVFGDLKSLLGRRLAL